MNVSHFCATCRLHARLRTRIRVLQLQRRPFSQSLPLAQDHPSPPQGRYSRLPILSTPSTNREHPPRLERKDAGQKGRRETTSNVSRFRGSGKALRPEELLTQLDQPVKARGKHRHSAFSSHGPLGPTQDERMPRPLFDKHCQFMQCPVNQEDEAWNILQVIVKNHGENEREMAVVGSNIWFQIRMSKSVLVAGKRMATLRTVTGDGSEHPRTVRPSQLLDLLPKFGIEDNELWHRTIWHMVSNASNAHNFLAEPRTAQESSDDSQTPAEYEKLEAILGDCMKEIMTLWNRRLSASLQRQADSTTSSPSQGELDWSFLPSTEDVIQSLRQQQDSEKMTFLEALKMVLPTADAGAKDPVHVCDFASSALLTLDILRGKPSKTAVPDYTFVNEGLYAPFVELVEALLQFAPVKSLPPALVRKSHEMANGTPHGYEKRQKNLQDTLTRLGLPLVSVRPPSAHRFPEQSSTRSNAIHDSKTPANPAKSTSAAIGAPPTVPLDFAISTSNNAMNQFVNFRIRGLSRAVQRQTPDLAEKIKREVFQYATTHKRTPIPNAMYEHLLLNLLVLRRPQSAIEVWNFFIKAGNTPTTKTYTVMMRGAHYIRDANGMESFWLKMRQAGLKPDNHAWSVRMFGQVKGGFGDKAIQALNEMGHEWLTAAKAKYLGANSAAPQRQQRKAQPAQVGPSAATLLATYPGDVDGVARPGQVVMNATISALAAKNTDLIPKALAWGRAFGLRPDLTTYNVLLHLSMRNGESDEAMDILQRMKGEGIEANSSTWTVLLTALFHGGSLDTLTHVEQEDKIMAFILSADQLGQGGVDEKGYALVIDRLLRFANKSAAQTVLNHMTAKGLTPTAHIYTILMASYFDPVDPSPEPKPQQPELEAIDSLWAHIQAQENGRGARLDDVFYDRMIEGYATHHVAAGPQPMLHFLELMLETGRRPSWRALELVVRAMDERGDVNGITRIVDKVRLWQREGLRVGAGVHVGARREYGQTSFWQFILTTGILKGEGVTDVEELRRRGFGENTFVAGGASL